VAPSALPHLALTPGDRERHHRRDARGREQQHADGDQTHDQDDEPQLALVQLIHLIHAGQLKGMAGRDVSGDITDKRREARRIHAPGARREKEGLGSQDDRAIHRR
jgi:hypothetical protein